MLDELGEARVTAREQRRYLLQLSQAFTGLVKAGVDGDYSDRLFFGDCKTAVGYERRLRARVQNSLTVFSEEMLTKGHSTAIVEDQEGALKNTHPKCIERSRFVTVVSIMIRRNKGRELPGTLNPLIVGELFKAQCRPWKGLTQKVVNDILNAVQDLLQRALEHVADEVTGQRLLRDVVNPSMTTLKRSVQEKLDELLTPHVSGHPITYNHYLIENIKRAQTDRHERILSEAFEKHVDLDDNDTHLRSPMELYKSVMKATEPNMDDYASMMAVDTMEAYYKVAMKKFTDDVSVLAIEQCLIDKLSSIFSLNIICDMADKDINELAGESEETVVLRKILTDNLGVLQEGLNTLGRVSKGRAQTDWDY